MINRIPIVLFVIMFFAATQSLASEKRCGWMDNPTPGNMWLIDNDDEWVISLQGQGAVTDDTDQSLNNLPEIRSEDHRFIRINGIHGFYCGCFHVLTDAENHRIKRILSGDIVELKQCMEDPNISSKIPLDLNR